MQSQVSWHSLASTTGTIFSPEKLQMPLTSIFYKISTKRKEKWIRKVWYRITIVDHKEDKKEAKDDWEFCHRNNLRYDQYVALFSFYRDLE